MGSQDSEKPTRSKPGCLTKEEYDKLERLIHEAGTPPAGKETIGKFIDGKSQEEISDGAGDEASEAAQENRES